MAAKYGKNESMKLYCCIDLTNNLFYHYPKFVKSLSGVTESGIVLLQSEVPGLQSDDTREDHYNFNLFI